MKEVVNQMSEGLEVYDREPIPVPEKVEGGIIQGSPKSFFALEQFFANLIKDETARQISDLKEEVSDLIGAQFDGFKVEQVADAVKAAVETAVADGKRVANMDSFKEIQQRYDINTKYDDIYAMIDGMGELRKEILSKRQTLRSIRQSMADADLFMKEAEASLLADITAEVNESTNKPAFSNDKARQAELMARKREDENYLAFATQYRTAKEQAEALEDEISSLDSELKSAEMQFQAECKSLEAMTAEMNIYAAALGAGAGININPPDANASGSYPGFLTKSNPENKNSESIGYLSPDISPSISSNPQNNINSESKGW
jgi:chromosome segregation ATPase